MRKRERPIWKARNERPTNGSPTNAETENPPSLGLGLGLLLPRR
jgi:hypothetical protein